VKEEFLKYVEERNSDFDLFLLERAFDLAYKAHEGQKRRSGEDYIIHPMEVAKILVDLDMDSQTVAAALLHDVVEDTDYTYDDMVSIFGEEIAALVDGVTKLGNIKFQDKEQKQAENLRKMFLAMTKDIRVLIIKLADRLHNMRTIYFMSDEKMVEKCQETLDIYAPLAHRLGIYKLKFELEDLALKALEPETYYSLVSGLRMKREWKQNDYIESVINEMKPAIDELGIKYEIYGRYKHYYSIYRKMQTGKTLDEIFDLSAIRVIVETTRDCYAVLGVVHTLWKPIPGRFKDYIAMPKPNMYQSLHTTLMGSGGTPFEVQIRTKEMHLVAEYGIAAHWKYKEGNTEDNEEAEKKLAWLRQTMELQNDVADPKEFMESLKVDLFSNQVYVFTPASQVMELPAGSTPLDFAYKIHTQVGNKCTGAKVNNKIVPLDYVLKNGQKVEIITSQNSKGPSTDWLNIVITSQAKTKIKQYFRRERREEYLEKGRDALEKAVRRRTHNIQDILRPLWLTRIFRSYNFTSLDEFYIAVGYGGVPATKVVNMLFDFYREEEAEENLKIQQEMTAAEFAEGLETTQENRAFKKDALGVRVKGVEGLMIQFAKCCTPVPGDDIIGYVTKGRGISVHRSDCSNMISLSNDERERLIEVEWDEDAMEHNSYEADICVIADDRKALIVDVSAAVSSLDMDFKNMNLNVNEDKKAIFECTLVITQKDQLGAALRKLRLVEGVREAYRRIK